MTKKELIKELRKFSDNPDVSVICPCGRATRVHAVTSMFSTKDIVIHTTINSPGETWMDIPGWDGKYQASDQGNVRNAKGEFLSQRLNRGWKIVSLRKNGKRFERRVHKLVAETFIRPFWEDENTHHINGIRHDNRLINLEIIPMRDHAKLHASPRNTTEYGRISPIPRP